MLVTLGLSVSRLIYYEQLCLDMFTIELRFLILENSQFFSFNG